MTPQKQMVANRFTRITALILLGIATAYSAPAQQDLAPESNRPLPATLVLEARVAMERGIGYLLDKQMADGSWGQNPAMTGLACMALRGGSAPRYGVAPELAVEKGRRFLRANARENGAICPEDGMYANYSTAICLTALAALGNPGDLEVMRKARRFLIGSQLDEDHPENPTNSSDPFYGGIGYGSGGPSRPDLSNTQWALEALAATDFLAREPYSNTPNDAQQTALAWEKAIQFLGNVQKISQDGAGGWILSGEDDGGFIYTPDSSKASLKLGDTQTLRSYGSMTYAGLKSMIYARLTRDDPRVKAALDWAKQHYTVDENPGMGAEGHFYYLHTFSKALALWGDDHLATPDGLTHSWRVDLVRKLLNLQKGEGQWSNDASGRWQESIPELVTCYALLSLQIALGDQQELD